MTAVKIKDTQAIKQALDLGRTFLTDPETGYHHEIHADCPKDGQPAPIRRIIRRGGGAISELVMHCTQCDTQFTPDLESLYAM